MKIWYCFRFKSVRMTACFVLTVLILPLLNGCGSVVEKPVSPVLTEQIATEPSNFETLASLSPPVETEPIVAEQTWKSCTIRVIYWLQGSEVYVFHCDGTYSMYITPNICDNLSSFTEGTLPFDEWKSGSLSETEREELGAIVSSVYAGGEMLPVGEPYESLYAIDCRLDVYFSVDGSEEAHILKNYTTWESYPRKEYDDLIEFLKRLDPESPILRR